jgi:hypothetical protein
MKKSTTGGVLLSMCGIFRPRLHYTESSQFKSRVTGTGAAGPAQTGVRSALSSASAAARLRPERPTQGHLHYPAGPFGDVAAY